MVKERSYNKANEGLQNRCGVSEYFKTVYLLSAVPYSSSDFSTCRERAGKHMTMSQAQHTLACHTRDLRMATGKFSSMVFFNESVPIRLAIGESQLLFPDTASKYDPILRRVKYEAVIQ